MKQVIVVLVVFFLACNSNNEPAKNCAESKILSLDTTTVMDTITVTAHGSIIDQCTSKGISALVKFKNNDYRFEFLSDSLGKYQSLHMPAGTYLVSAKQKKYKSLSDTLIEFKSGVAMTLNLGLAPEE